MRAFQLSLIVVIQNFCFISLQYHEVRKVSQYTLTSNCAIAKYPTNAVLNYFDIHTQKKGSHGQSYIG